MTESFGKGKDLGTNILTGALMGGAGAAFGYALKHGVFSQADVAQQGGGQQGLAGDEEYQARRAEHTEYVKSLAVKNGQVSNYQLGDLPVEVYGETGAERDTAFAALKTDLTKGGDVAKAMSQDLLSRTTADGSVRPLDIVLTRSYNSYSNPGGNTIVVDVQHDLGSSYTSRIPGGKFSYERILAHELGHAALGYYDMKIDMMYNVRNAENPIMRSLGDTNDRVSYW